MRNFLSLTILTGMLLMAAGCMGGVSYENKDGLVLGAANPAAEQGLRSLPRPLRLTVMPVSLQPLTPDPELKRLAADKAFLQELWDTLVREIDARPARFERVPLPAGPEADRIMNQTMMHAAGLLPAEEFAKVKGFKLPQRFVYGTVAVELRRTVSLGAPDQAEYRADLFLRFVEGQSLAGVTVTGSGRGPDVRAAAAAALRQALDRLN